jgi:hypothetical protein
MELGWRQRDERRMQDYVQRRDQLATLTRGLIHMQACRSTPGAELAIQLYFPQEMFTVFVPHETKDMMRYYAAELGYMLERELRTMNFATLADHIRENERRQALHRPSEWLAPSVPAKEIRVTKKTPGYAHTTLEGVCGVEVTVQDIRKEIYHPMFGGRGASVHDGKWIAIRYDPTKERVVESI